MKKLLCVLLLVVSGCTKLVQEETFCWHCKFIPEYPNVWTYEVDTCGVPLSEIEEVTKGIESEFKSKWGIDLYGDCQRK